MTTFAILLGGTIAATARLLGQVRGARVIAADSGMAHAAVLGLTPELWIGDFDSAGSELALRYRDVPRETHPPEKNATDGGLAIAEALRRGASEIVMVGALGGQADHMLGHMGQALQLARAGQRCLLTSGREEAYPFVRGETLIDLPATSRVSLIPFTDLEGLDLAGVQWPLINRAVPLGSTLTLSNVAHGPVRIGLRSGYGMAVAYPAPADG